MVAKNAIIKYNSQPIINNSFREPSFDHYISLFDPRMFEKPKLINHIPAGTYLVNIFDGAVVWDSIS